MLKQVQLHIFYCLIMWNLFIRLNDDSSLFLYSSLFPDKCSLEFGKWSVMWLCMDDGFVLKWKFMIWRILFVCSWLVSSFWRILMRRGKMMGCVMRGTLGRMILNLKEWGIWNGIVLKMQWLFFMIILVGIIISWNCYLLMKFLFMCWRFLKIIFGIMMGVNYYFDCFIIFYLIHFLQTHITVHFVVMVSHYYYSYYYYFY